jgi:hypothetical protein
VTLEKIAAFQAEYQGSQEEREDVLRAYVDCQGKMARVIDCVMLANDGGWVGMGVGGMEMVVCVEGGGEGGGSSFYSYSFKQNKTKQNNTHTIGSATDDEPRFRAVIEAAIAAKEVPRFKGFKKQAKEDGKRQAKASKVGVCLCVCKSGWVLGGGRGGM